jgi:hypothetical protein
VLVEGKITPKCGKYQGATTDHPRGQRRKDRTSCKWTPYLDHGDDDAKMTQLKGIKFKMMRGPIWRKGATEPGRNGSRSADPAHSGVGSASHFLSVDGEIPST